MKQKSKLRVDVASQLSGEEIETLGRIGKRIRGCWDEANCLAARARASGNDAVKAALLCGEALLEAKGVLGHGRFGSWLERHCAEVAHSYETAARWMRLATANLSGVTVLEAGSLTAAYRLVGILPALERSSSGEGDGEAGDGGKGMTIDGLVGRLSFFRKVQSAVRSAVVGWTIEERRRLAEELRPLIDLYRELMPGMAM